ncbi:MAG: hypothetical protein EXS31_17985 [Pedosphaera sp.]|nr:hypothetical protein [Pedosphaera sp.]
MSCSVADAAGTNECFGIKVVDEQTGRGVPLVELETVHHVKLVTDSAGWVAINEPGWNGQSVFFHVRSHGYEFPKDGFGNAGKALKVIAGARESVRVKRRNVAERLYRITGEGIYRESVLLGEDTPLAEPLGSGRVVGQDSAFAVPYRGKLHWFWGDTSRLSYPLGHFWMAGALSDLPGSGGLDPSKGVNLSYFKGSDGFSRPMCRLGVKRGLIWADGFTTLIDDAGRERLVCHYAHMESLEKMLGHGLAVYDDGREEFTRVDSLELKELWRWPAQAHPVRKREGDMDYLMAGEVFPVVRVPAQWKHWTNLMSYEGWSCLADSSSEEGPMVDRDADGKVRWRWRRGMRAVDSMIEAKLISSGKLDRSEARFSPVDVESGKPVLLHRGSVNWNPHRKRWVMIAVETGGTSMLGEVWYGEALEPTGPCRKVRKIVTHDRYSFYNPVHHVEFDKEDGRWIFFEGTYVNTFSGNSDATARYDYNQVMYRLDLDDPRLRGLRE